MIRNYLKIARRNLLKNKMNTAINIIGLSIGMACCILIVMYVVDERSYDRYWPNGERIYRVALERKYPDRVAKYAIIPDSYASVLKRDIPGVEEVVRLFTLTRNAPAVFKYQGRVFEESNVLAADSTFFEVFQTALIRGNPDQVLNRPNTVVLTQQTARRLFGKANPVGKVIELVQGPKLEVTGVCADLPPNIHFTFDFLLSTVAQPNAAQPENFISFSATTYLRLKPEVQPKTVQAQFPTLVEKYAAGQVQRNFGVSYKEYLKAGSGYFYFLQPLRGIHLNSHLEDELGSNGSQTLVTIFSLIAMFVLLIAAINFMNLATARSAERAREVGIRKSLGSTKSQLAMQFLTESVLLSLFSFGIAVLLVAGLLPYFNDLAGKELSLSFLAGWRLPAFLLLAGGIGLLAGSYPAGVLAAFEPIKVLKGKFSATRQGYLLRNGLVVFQFAISVALIVCTLVVFRQMHYIQTKELGFNKEAVITIQGAGFLNKNTRAFKEEASQLAGVKQVGGTSSTPDAQNFFGITFRRPAETETVTGRAMVIDDEYLASMGMTMLTGRSFSRDFNDSLSVILNEEAVRELGLTDPIGKQVKSPDTFGAAQAELTYTVVGVVKNFHFASLHQRITPLFILHDKVFNGFNNQIVMRFSAPNPQAAITQTEALWKRYLPDQPFHYSFLDTDWNRLYQSEQVSERIFSLFSLLAIFIACMGLLGLVIYVIQQRVKEIGIRKVLGASVTSIVALLSKDFLKLVLIAILIATPVAWYAMSRWLADFAYKIELEWWIFALAGALAVGIALLTVSFQAIKAALMNPLESLRSE
ncbi:ABC transporter permease [Rhabdobacter roseus]|uniref:Putative ABC transport system permease protein n=1 Tax=Rhabdobacter roseus TaxID=1655419 RepID=A0A840U145_9BACT|nr:ABC transporter permease [Rhabdobacter roseus]MBB5285589.1 putative ABC transport system permease protein [Rhabdobacter roseus]